MIVEPTAIRIFTLIGIGLASGLVLGFSLAIFAIPKIKVVGWHHFVTSVTNEGRPVLYVDGEPLLTKDGRPYGGSQGLWMDWSDGEKHMGEVFHAEGVRVTGEDVKKIYSRGLSGRGETLSRPSHF